MTFLKKVGQIIVRGAAFVSGFVPLIQAVKPDASGVIQTVSADLAQLAQIIVQVEAMGASLGLPGQDKLRAAAPQIAQILLQSSVLAGKPISNGPLFTQGATKIADGLADVLNSVHASAVESTPVPTAA